MSDLHKQAARLGIKPPSLATLRRYGITAHEWLTFVKGQGWKCPICQKRPRLWNVDHHHVAGWKHKAPVERARYVRGVLCAHCNWKLVHSNIDSATVGRIADYLRAYEARRDSA